MRYKVIVFGRDGHMHLDYCITRVKKWVEELKSPLGAAYYYTTATATARIFIVTTIDQPTLDLAPSGKTA